MKIYLIRHTEPDYQQVTEANYKGFGRDLSRITEKGIHQAKKLAEQPLFDEVELLLVSPYTRTMQTALEIVKERKQPLTINVELLLHEWLPDKTGTKLESCDQVGPAYQDYLNQTNFSKLECETQEEVKRRVEQVFDKYKQEYNSIVCITHAEVIKLFTGVERVAYCGIYELEY